MHLVGFIIRIYHDARSPERQIRTSIYKHNTLDDIIIIIIIIIIITTIIIIIINNQSIVFLLSVFVHFRAHYLQKNTRVMKF